MTVLFVMDRESLTRSPFPVMEHLFPAELIFPSEVHSLNRPYLTAFGNCIKMVSKQNEGQKSNRALWTPCCCFLHFYGLSWDHKNNIDINVKKQNKQKTKMLSG